MSLLSGYHKPRRLWRNDYMLVGNPLYSDRFFQACQRIKHKRYVCQQVFLCAWKLKRNGVVVDEQAECAVDVTELMLKITAPLTQQQYVDLVNRCFNTDIVLDAESDMTFTFELRYRYRSHQ